MFYLSLMLYTSSTKVSTNSAVSRSLHRNFNVSSLKIKKSFILLDVYSFSLTFSDHLDEKYCYDTTIYFKKFLVFFDEVYTNNLNL